VHETMQGKQYILSERSALDLGRKTPHVASRVHVENERMLQRRLPRRLGAAIISMLMVLVGERALC